MTKRNIYQKLHDACLSAGSVKKGTKANGMHFNPLLHDKVQEVATQALLDNGLYATCNYLKFGTGNAMSYSRKYAFLNLLNLKTGIKDEDGYEAKPFEQDSPEQSVEEPTYADDSIDVEDIKHELKNAETIKGFNIAKEKHRASVEYLLRNNLRAYRQISDIAETREFQLNNGQ